MMKQIILYTLCWLCCLTSVAQQYDEREIIDAIYQSQRQMVKRQFPPGKWRRRDLSWVRLFRDMRKEFGLPCNDFAAGDTVFFLDRHYNMRPKFNSALWKHARPETFKTTNYYGTMYSCDEEPSAQSAFDRRMIRICDDWDWITIKYLSQSKEYRLHHLFILMYLTRIIFHADGTYEVESERFLEWQYYPSYLSDYYF